LAEASIDGGAASSVLDRLVVASDRAAKRLEQ
jgi:hypothetical protein